MPAIPAEKLAKLAGTPKGMSLPAVADFQAFCRQTGNELVEHSEDDSVFRFLIRHTAA